ncbi:MAG: ParB N-terminal domain-containing protein [Pseudotabrizicola sp.]|uniref:ParB/RepB/Spo0J family partition protein n=1 Tax=Pseudotabrizicola sp. TaxID=2939647 RepID=UPI00271F1A87|nr:ParB N-terminal domain-containing protein [Pseudotabrizicola sp.]MDO9640841.1 ParB N-terminal domain-containing protein [Pseudotabrizicola sp.]
MAKRRRLTSFPFLAEDTGSERAQNEPLETKAFLRPGLGSPAPIAQVVAEASAQAALTELSDAMARARAEGRLVLRLALDQIDCDHLMRDRISLDEDELAPLMTSLRSHGQRTPVEVVELASGRFGLISGWRRIQALTRLFSETGEQRFAEVQALLRQPGSAQDAYVAMVEENEIRLGLSYYERARIAARAVDAGVFETEKQALQRLFASASRARRSKIGSFLSLYRLLDGVLRFPAALPERLGLALAQALDQRPAEAQALVDRLAADPAPDPAGEQARLAAFVSGKTGSDTAKTKVLPPSVKEFSPGVFLEVSGGWSRPVLTLSGPRVDPDFRDALERWLATRG